MARLTYNLTGKSFGRLTALSYDSERRQWICECACGQTAHIDSYNLRHARVRSCGCLQAEWRSKIGKAVFSVKDPRLPGRRHGHASDGALTPEYRIWVRLKLVCYNFNHRGYSKFGAQGVGMSARWRESFEAFLADVGSRPSPYHSIRRIDVSKDFEPGNCVWSTHNRVKSRRKLSPLSLRMLAP
jgi:hypothetical protein